METFIKLIQKPVFWIITLALIVVYFIWNSKKSVSLPGGGAGIPSGWSPVIPATAIRQSLDVWFFPDTDLLFQTLNGLQTKDMLAATLNYYNKEYKRDLVADFQSKLSGEDLTRALGYFTGVVKFKQA